MTFVCVMSHECARSWRWFLRHVHIVTQRFCCRLFVCVLEREVRACKALVCVCRNGSVSFVWSNDESPGGILPRKFLGPKTTPRRRSVARSFSDEDTPNKVELLMIFLVAHARHLLTLYDTWYRVYVYVCQCHSSAATWGQKQLILWGWQRLRQYVLSQKNFRAPHGVHKISTPSTTPYELPRFRVYRHRGTSFNC